MQTCVTNRPDAQENSAGCYRDCALCLLLVRGDIEQARVVKGSEKGQRTLFPLDEYSTHRRSPRDVADRIGLNWLAVEELHRDGWLSFDPRKVPRLNAPQEAELRFVGSLVAAGCDEGMLGKLLSGLSKPYAYRLERVYYDWETQSWMLVPTHDHLSQNFGRWVDELTDSGDLGKLQELRDRVSGSINALRRLVPW